MNLFKHIIWSGLIAFVFLSSCKNDLKLNAPYKEIPLVYAVLSPQDHLQMIRINKAFLGEGDANKMAQIADSVNYPAGELQVTLERFVNGIRTPASLGGSDIITFRDSVVQTDAGSFSTTQRIYVTGERLFTFGDYILKIKNKRTNNEYMATSKSLDSIPSGYAPFTLNNLYGDPDNVNHPADPKIFIDYSEPARQYQVRFYPNESVLYQLNMRFHYYDSTITGQRIPAFVDYQFGRQSSRDITISAGQKFIVNGFRGSDLYSSVGSSMSHVTGPANLLGRRLYKIQYFVYTSTQDYLDYLEFSAPSLSIAQEKPLYTNFTDKKAYGIFTFRTRYSLNREMDRVFIDQFAVNSNTCKYKFYSVSNGVALKPCP